MTDIAGISRIRELTRVLDHGRNTGQDELDRVARELTGSKNHYRPRDKTERLPLFDETGRPLGTTAPRWICHLLALRHRCVHILLVWKSPAMGDALVLQIRNWDKDDSPGQADISVGGHMTAAGSAEAEAAAFREMLEETGLTQEDLVGVLVKTGGYAHDESRPNDNFFNSEWRDVYIARIDPARFSRIHFQDGEVAGMLLVPLTGADRLLKQDHLPMASALVKSLPVCLEFLKNRAQ
ncbi:NUDIX domain-containing protein [bacterium]|nr:NUDIX domain-containing protein [bacterium]